MTTPTDSIALRTEGILLQYADSSLDGSWQLRDLARGLTYRVDHLNEFLILRSDRAILDTVSTFGTWCGTYGHTITVFDSAFLVYEAVCRGGSATGETEIYCIAEASIS